MAFDEKSLLWFNGKYVRWADAKIHVMSHVVHYGSNVFEGIRCYKTPSGSAIFRLDDHIKRLFRSAKVYRMDIPFTEAEFVGTCVDLVRKNRYDDAYIRPLIFRGYGTLGIDPTKCPVVAVIGLWPWGKYLGDDALEQGVDVCISSWRKIAPSTLAALSKAGGQYLNSQLVKLEAKSNGYVEGILLDANGFVSEGSGENIFVKIDNRVYTPPLASSILTGITRESVMTLLTDHGVEIVEQPIPREMLYIADEIFFTGTAAEITPVRSIDKMTIADGKPGELTRLVQKQYFGIIAGEAADTHGWLTHISR